MQRRAFRHYDVPPPKAKGIDVVTTLRDFALITYTVEPERLASELPRRLSPLTISMDGAQRALVSVVVFWNARFQLARWPSPSFNMPQINYRAYVIDNDTGEHAIWFLHTLLGSWAYVVPRYVWKMPWSKGTIRLTCRRQHVGRAPGVSGVPGRDERAGADAWVEGLYRKYVVIADSSVAPATIELKQKDPEWHRPVQLPGFPDDETGLVCLTHAFQGFFRRHDGRIGLNQVWHEQMPVRTARLVKAKVPYLVRSGFITEGEQSKPYNVLLVPAVPFFSQLPPAVIH